MRREVGTSAGRGQHRGYWLKQLFQRLTASDVSVQYGEQWSSVVLSVTYLESSWASSASKSSREREVWPGPRAVLGSIREARESVRKEKMVL